MINDENIKFDHEANKITQSLGIEHEDTEVLFEKLANVLNKELGEQAKPSQCLEVFLTTDALSDSEKLFAIYFFGKNEATMEALSSIQTLSGSMDVSGGGGFVPPMGEA